MTASAQTAGLPARPDQSLDPGLCQAARFAAAFRQETPQALMANMQLLRQHQPQASRHPGANEVRLEFPDGSSAHLFREQGQLLFLQGCTLLQTPLPSDKAGPQESPQSSLLNILYQYLEGCRPQWDTHGCAAAANPEDGSIPLHAPNLGYLQPDLAAAFTALASDQDPQAGRRLDQFIHRSEFYAPVRFFRHTLSGPQAESRNAYTIAFPDQSGVVLLAADPNDRLSLLTEYGLRRIPGGQPGDTILTGIELRAFQGGGSAAEQWLNALLDRLEANPSLPEYAAAIHDPAGR